MSVAPRPKANYLKALGKLEAFTQRDVTDELVRTAIIQAFEYTFETAWKVARSAADSAGIAAPGPRPSLQAGVTLGLLEASDEDAWLNMIADRNLSVHTYNENIAVAIFTRVQNEYLPVFRRLAAKL